MSDAIERISAVFFPALLATSVLATGVSEAGFELPSSGFVLETSGEFESWVDRRDLVVMHHPWVPSVTDGYASATIAKTLPEDLSPPFRLHFYVSDDYFNDFWRAKNDSWLGGDGFFGHRFKEVWVNGKLVWESDVADPNPPDVMGNIAVELDPDIQPGQPLEVSLRVVDRVSCLVHLASDTQHISTTETHAEKPGDPPKHMTHVYWGDAAILAASEAFPAPALPLSGLVESRHRQRWPLPPYGDPELDLPLDFTLSVASPLPQSGFPVHCGAPLPFGKVRTATEVALFRSSGELRAADLRSMARWEDGSIRWLEVRFVAQPGDEGKTFVLGPRWFLGYPVRAAEELSPPRIEIGSTPVGAGLKPAPTFFHRAQTPPGTQVLWRAEIELRNGVVFSASGGSPSDSAPTSMLGAVDVSGVYSNSEAGNPLCRFNHSSEGLVPCRIDPASIASVIPPPRRGRLGGGELRDSPTPSPTPRGEGLLQHQGHKALGQLPIITMKHRLYFHALFPSAFVEFRLASGYPTAGSVEIVLPNETRLNLGGQGTESEEHTYVIDDERRVRIDGEIVAEASPACNWAVIRDASQARLFVIRYAGETGQAGFRVGRAAGSVEVQCLPYTSLHSKRGYPFTPGEAKTFQVLFASLPADVADAEFARIAENFERPPILNNNDPFCRTGAFGYALPPNTEATRPLCEFLDRRYPEPLSQFGWGRNQRDFGDTIYNATNSWRNGYYDVRQGFVAAYLLTGRRDWVDALERAVQHYVDVDVIHSSTGHPDWVGLPHGYGENHTSMDPWNPITRLNGILEAAHLWGDRSFHEAAIRMASAIVDTERGVGAVSVRDHAGIMMSLAAAYRETRDSAVKEAADKLVSDILHHRIEPRRGCYSEVHGNWNYRGNVPWMVVQLVEPLYLYYRESGNLDAAKMVVGLADSILCENQVRGVPGDIHGYSHNPHYKKNSGYHVLIAPSLFYAYELTGKEEFLEAGWAAWEQTVREDTINDVQNCLWNAPTLSYYLQTTQRPSAR